MIDYSQFHREKSVDFGADFLLQVFGENYLALRAITLIKTQIPMYTGDLNPRWKYWSSVQNILTNQ